MFQFVGNGVTTCWCEKDKKNFTCLKTLQAYNHFIGYMDLIDFDKKNWWWICNQAKMIQERISWFARFHPGKQQSNM